MRIGFLLSHLGESELAKLFVKHTNEYLGKNPGVDVIAFVSNQSRAVKRPSFASMNINEAFDFKGVLVATDIYTAEKIVRFPGPSRLYYYLWELDWTKDSDRKFEDYLGLFNDRRITLVARTSEDGKMIEDCWNRPVRAIIPDCNTEAFVEMVRRDENYKK